SHQPGNLQVIGEFFAYAASFTGGVRVAAADVNRDGKADIITGAGQGGGPHVKVFSGANGTVLREFFAYVPQFTGGVYVAAGDFNADGVPDIVTGPGLGGGPHVEVFDGRTGAVLISAQAFSTSTGAGGARPVAERGPGGGAGLQPRRHRRHRRLAG